MPVLRVLSVALAALLFAACSQEPAGISAASVPTPAATAQAADPANTLIMELKGGVVKIRLRPDIAPRHVERVKQLTSEGFYNGLKFHRVIPGFMAQTGDPKGDGSGGSNYPDLPAEFTPTAFERGTVGAARSGSPNSANSQFFICFTHTPHLNGQYTIWGQVVEGMPFVDQLAKGEPPANPDIIIRMYLESNPPRG